MIIAFIGTRSPGDLPPHYIQLFNRAATLAGSREHGLVTGAAPGADQCAAQAALGAGGKVALIIPWRGFEKAWIERVRAKHAGRVAVRTLPKDFNQIPEEWTRSVKKHHPAAGSLSEWAIRCHARNYGIVEMADMVVALPSVTKLGKGGTGQGIRVALALKKRLIDLSEDEDRWELEDWLKVGK